MQELMNFLAFSFDYILLLLGGLDGLLNTLFIILLLDVVTCGSKLLYYFKFDMKKIIMWLVRNIGILVVIMLSVVMDTFLNNGEIIRDVVILSFIVNKITSILIIWKDMGLKLPSIISKTLDKIKSLK